MCHGRHGWRAVLLVLNECIAAGSDLAHDEPTTREALLLQQCWSISSGRPRSCCNPPLCLVGVVHGTSGAAAAAAAQLRDEVRDAAGRLGRQLFDRNSQRAFAPAAAFAAESVQV